jgi:hypothetical protein
MANCRLLFAASHRPSALSQPIADSRRHDPPLKYPLLSITLPLCMPPGMDPQQAVDAPRFRHMMGLRVGLEPPISDAIRSGLTALGHQIVELGPESAGGAQVIIRSRGAGSPVPTRGRMASRRGTDPKEDVSRFH